MYSMKEACELTDMTYENLKFYCNEGLVPNVKRDKRNCSRLSHSLTGNRTSMMMYSLGKRNTIVI